MKTLLFFIGLLIYVSIGIQNVSAQGHYVNYHNDYPVSSVQYFYQFQNKIDRAYMNYRIDFQDRIRLINELKSLKRLENRYSRDGILSNFELQRLNYNAQRLENQFYNLIQRNYYQQFYGSNYNGYHGPYGNYPSYGWNYGYQNNYPYNHHNNGNHNGQYNNGNHYGNHNNHHNNGNHYGNSNPHQNNGNHYGYRNKDKANSGNGKSALGEKDKAGFEKDKNLDPINMGATAQSNANLNEKADQKQLDDFINSNSAKTRELKEEKINWEDLN